MKRILLTISLLVLIWVGKGQGWLDKAVLDGRVDSVWNAIDLPQAFNGEGVIIGFVDWGFDYSHPVFSDTNMTQYRVLRAWDQFKTSGPAPAGYDYGTEYVGPGELLTAQCDTSNCYGYHYHGTHCASIAAGAGAGTKYRGVAHKANLLFASLYLDSIRRVMDAWNWMYEVAQAEGKRLVISNSWGLYYMDNMDGTGLLANEMQRLTDLGVLFVVSAGNNGDVNFHIHHDFTGASDTVRTQFLFPYNSGTGWGSSITMMNSANSPFEFSMMVMNADFETIEATAFIQTAGNDGFVDTFLVVNGDTLIYTYDIQSSNAFNNAPVVRLRVKQNNTYKFGLAVTAPSGSFHAWNVAEVTRAYGNWGADFRTPPAHPDWLAGDIEYASAHPATSIALSQWPHMPSAMSTTEVMWLVGRLPISPPLDRDSMMCVNPMSPHRGVTSWPPSPLTTTTTRAHIPRQLSSTAAHTVLAPCRAPQCPHRLSPVCPLWCCKPTLILRLPR